MGRNTSGVRCWLRVRHGAAGWSAGTPGHCAIWGRPSAWSALRGARTLHRLARGSRRSAGAPDITMAFSAVSGPREAIRGNSRKR